MNLRFLKFFAFSLILAPVAQAVEPGSPAWQPEGVSIVAYARPTRVTVGDRILYTVGVAAPEGVAVSWPPIGQSLGDFRILDLGEQASGKTADGKKKVSHLYGLRVYETGQRYVPSMTIGLRNEKGDTADVQTGEIGVNVVSVLDKEAKDIRDIKPPFSLAYFPAGFLLWIALACAAVAAVIMWVKRRRGGKVERKPELLPPHVIAYEQLRRILAMNLIEKGRVKEFYIRISDVVRRYIERRFGLKAPDRTTKEFLAEARASGLLDARARTLVGDFLEECDMVKFAKYGPLDEEINAAYRAARRFVDETKVVAGRPGVGDK